MAEWLGKYKRAPWRQDSSASASEGWWREDQEQLIVSCAQVIVDIEVVESLLRLAGLGSYAGRDEVRRFTSERALALQEEE